MSTPLLTCLERWKPLTDVVAGSFSVIISLIALLVSFYAVYISRSSPDLSAHPGRHFGVAVVRGTHLAAWELPFGGHSESERFLILDFSLVFSTKADSPT